MHKNKITQAIKIVKICSQNIKFIMLARMLTSPFVKLTCICKKERSNKNPQHNIIKIKNTKEIFNKISSTI